MSNHLTLYEKDQRVRTLSAITWIVLIASVILGLLNIQSGTWGIGHCAVQSGVDLCASPLAKFKGTIYPRCLDP